MRIGEGKGLCYLGGGPKGKSDRPEQHEEKSKR